MNRRQPPAEEKLRLFVAVELPETWRSALQQLQEDMKAALTAQARTRDVRVRWVRPEGIHLTLKFLGYVVANRLEAIEAALDGAVQQAPDFELRLGRAGSFSDRRAPRVIWAGIDIGGGRIDRSELGRLAERIDTWLSAASFAREKRAFAPHLTLARLPDDLAQEAREAVAQATTAVPPPRAPAFRVTSISLMRSQLGPGGATYERLASFPRPA